MGTKQVCWAIIVVWLTLLEGNTMLVKGDFNYKEALTKSLIFLEAQRSMRHNVQGNTVLIQGSSLQIIGCLGEETQHSMMANSLMYISFYLLKTHIYTN